MKKILWKIWCTGAELFGNEIVRAEMARNESGRTEIAAPKSRGRINN